MQCKEISEGVSDVFIKRTKKKVIKNNPQNKKINQNKSHFFKYLYLFAFVFIAALLVLSVIIKSYTPNIDVSIGNNEAFTINETDADMEMKTVDERLKWIQMEDDLPSVSIKNDNHSEREIKKTDREEKSRIYRETTETVSNKASEEVKEERIKQKQVSGIKEEKMEQDDFHNIPAKEVLPSVRVAITRVYLGNYQTAEEASVVKNKVLSIEPNISPFIKSVKGHYIVQLGSFSDGEKAGALAEKLRAKGYYPKVTYEN